MEKQDDSQKKQWSLFQAFCCGPKAAKKRQPTNNFQPESNDQSAREANGCISMQRNTHNNQTGIAMRPTAVNDDINNNNNNNFGNNEQDDNNESLSSSNKLYIYQQQQLQCQQLRIQQQQQQQQQQPYSVQQYPQSNHVIKINSHQNHHHRQSSQQYEPSHLSILQQQQLQQLQHVSNSSQQQQQPSHPQQQQQSLHRRAYSVHHQSSSLSQQGNELIIQEVQQSQVSSASSYLSQRVDTQQSNQSGSSSSRRQQQQQPYYTMTNQFFSLKTKYAIHEIDFVETRPTDKEFQSYFTFDCPICFRHFNNILKSDCCDHYLCHYCLRDIYNKAKDSNDNFKFRCMFCQLPVPLYVDAECAADKIKRYSDSPFITPKEQTAGRVEETVQPFNIHHNNNLIEFAEDSSSIDKENVYNTHHNGQHFVNAACSVSHTINKPPLPHLAVGSKLQPEVNSGIDPRRDKNLSLQENENVNQSAHKPAGLIPEFQNKYHCNYLQNNLIQGNNQQQKSSVGGGGSSSSSSLSINQNTSIKLIR